jgi:hypothetical protein
MRRLFIAILPLLLAACANVPTIKSEKFARPKTVAIVEAPAMRNAALIGVVGYQPNFHFSPASDYFFLLDPSKNPAGEPLSTGNGGIVAATSVSILAVSKTAPFNNGNVAAQLGASFLIGALIDANAANTQSKAENFHLEVAKQMPDLDLRTEFSSALQNALKAKGIPTMLVTDSVNAPSRLRWPANDSDAEAKQLPVAAGALPAVDADLLLQYSPIAIYMAPGPLNNYRVRAIVGIAIYNGRTKEFLGRQNFSFDPSAWQNEYASYSQLAKDIDTVVPAVRTGLMSLVPTIVDIISKENKPG